MFICTRAQIPFDFVLRFEGFANSLDLGLVSSSVILFGGMPVFWQMLRAAALPIP